MNKQAHEIFMAQVIQETDELLTASGAAPTLDTRDLYFLMGSIGHVMKDAGGRKKTETLTMLREMSERLLESGEPTQIAKGMLIGAFAAGCFDLSKLG
ncbi:hypothetical protein [Delftia lacustris]|uniref:hypothetical protein n=1 Tax=Delftia lacustris TaxID=558537 RepID=UPI0035A5E945